jgi:hypothetical protein
MKFRELPRLCTRVGTLACGLLLIASLTSRASAVVTGIDPKIKTGGNAANDPAIAAWVKNEVAALSDVSQRSAAREQMIAEVVTGGGGAPLSPQFLDEYAKQLNTQLLPLLTNQDPANQALRLNVAIIVSKVAEKVDNVRLLDITLQLLNDKSDAVLMWALRAAKWVLPPVIQGSTDKQLQQLLAAIRAHAGPNANPMLLSLAYESLTLNDKKNSPNWGKMVSVVLPEIHKLVSAREAVFLTQIPPEPLANLSVANFLISRNVLTAPGVQPALHVQSIQIILDLIGIAGERADAATGVDKNQMVDLISQLGKSLTAAALVVGTQDVANQINQDTRVNANTPNLSAVGGKVLADLKAVPAWATLKPPPHISAGGGATSAPTTAPATAAK